MFRTFFFLEIRLWLRGLLIYVLLASVVLLLLLATTTNRLTLGDLRSTTCRFNSPCVIHWYYLTLNDFFILLTVLLTGTAAARDFKHRTFELVFCRPVSRISCLLGRFLGSTLVSILPVLGVSVAILIAPFLSANEPNRWGPVYWQTHACCILLFVIPNALFVNGLAFAASTQLRNSIGALIVLPVVYFQEQICRDLAAVSSTQIVASVLDPSGIQFFIAWRRHMTLAEANTTLLVPSGAFLLSRLMWCAVGILIASASVIRLSSDRSPQTSRHNSSPAWAVWLAQTVSSATPKIGLKPALLQFFCQFRLNLCAIIFSRIFLLLALFAIWSVTDDLMTVADVGFDVKSFPVTYHVTQAIVHRLRNFVLAIIIVFTGFAVWTEREQRVDELIDAQPHSSIVMYAAKLLAVVFAAALIYAAGVTAGVVTQATVGYTRFQFWLYATEIGGIRIYEIMISAIAAMLLQIVIPRKSIGIAFVFVVAVINLLSFQEGSPNQLWVPGDLGYYIYSDFYGFGSYAASMLVMACFWVPFFGLLCVAGVLCWQRGRETQIRLRLVEARRRWTGALRYVSLALLAVWATLGAFVYFSTRGASELKREIEDVELAVRYEQDLRPRMINLSQPHVTRARYEIDLDPARRSLELRGADVLVNRDVAPQSSLVLTLARGYETALEVERGVLKEDLRELRVKIYELVPPLQPGEELRLKYTVRYEAQGIDPFLTRPEIQENGIFFGDDILPHVGYDENREVRDRRERRLRGLSERQVLPPGDPDNLQARTNNFVRPHSDWVEMETIVSTADDQIAIAPGSLIRSWKENGRSWFHYKLDSPSLMHWRVLSARYEVARDEWNGIKTEVYFHPEHAWNVPDMMKSMHKSLEYYTQNFGPYPHRQARIVEFPRIASFAAAFAGTMPYSESIGFIADLRDKGDINMVFYVVAHEIAHQWWMYQVVGADMEGSKLLSETLAEYSALMVMEKEFGRELTRRVLRHELEGYLFGRSSLQRETPEKPLRRADDDQDYLNYDKGCLVMYLLKETIGEARVNAALRTLLDRYGFKGPPYPTASDLIDALREQTPPEHAGLLEELFDRITLYDNKALSAEVKKLAEDRWQVTLEVECRRLQADGDGAEEEVPIEQPIEVGAFAAPEPGKEFGATLFRERRKLRSGRNTVIFETNRRPHSAGVDPFLLLIDRNTENNLQNVQP
ncbi:MAG: hypothetical protein RL215_1314 [Planctomycetota bacterium]